MPSDSSRPTWNDVDNTAERATDYLDSVTGVEAIQDYKRRSHRLLHPSQGDCILDVGCGAGDDVLMLADQVRPEGEVVGLDSSKSLIAEARERTGETDGVSFVVGDAMKLPFEENTVDACRADRVFQHLTNPPGALAEMCRVTRPGGRVTATDPNWDTCVVTAPDVETEINQRISDRPWTNSRNPAVGHRLYALVNEAGLTNIEIDPVTIVIPDFRTANEVFYLADRLEMMQEADVLSADEAEQWLAGVRQADTDDLFFSSMTGCTVAGTVPSE
jgi:ubiquinone/menaquinone biosynthesis C-methylase UbiE